MNGAVTFYKVKMKFEVAHFDNKIVNHARLRNG